MTLSDLSPTQLSAGQIALAGVLAVAGFALLLPRPKGRAATPGIAALFASAAVLGTWLYTTFGDPMPDAIGSVLFWLFSVGAVGFGAALVVQKNPARGAMAFAFVILSTCGLFLLLAAPFLMAATIIIYAGAIIVTFLFVLMLSHAEGPSDENDRSREPLFGAFAGFAFTGLVLFTLYLTALGNTAAKAEQRLPAVVLTTDERSALADAIDKLDAADEQLSGDLTTGRAKRVEYFAAIADMIVNVESTLRTRLEKSSAGPGTKAVLFREDEQARNVLKRADAIRDLNSLAFTKLQNGIFEQTPDVEAAKQDYHKLREEALLLYGSVELPARNVGNIGYLLYTDHLLAVELAGTLLLVAAIGAIAIAQRKGAAA